MLEITVPEQELYDEEKEEFLTIPKQTLVLEHSLISISKWEAKWKKPYMDDKQPKTTEETLDYIRCMTVQPKKLDPIVYKGLTKENVDAITDYINDPMTATTISHYGPKKLGKKETITSELIYYWMVAQNVPTEYEMWHINRLMTLLEICAIKNDPNPKKMSRSAIGKQNRALNAARRAKYHTKG